MKTNMKIWLIVLITICLSCEKDFNIAEEVYPAKVPVNVEPQAYTSSNVPDPTHATDQDANYNWKNGG